MTIEAFAAARLAEDVVLVTFRSISQAPGGAARHALRSSIWVRRESRWRLRFHQGTPTIDGASRGP